MSTQFETKQLVSFSLFDHTKTAIEHAADGWIIDEEMFPQFIGHNFCLWMKKEIVPAKPVGRPKANTTVEPKDEAKTEDKAATTEATA